MRRFVILAAVLSLALTFAVPVGAGTPDRADRPVPERLDDLKLDTPRSATFDPATLGPQPLDPGRVIVRLIEPSVTEKGLRGNAAKAERRALKNEQDDLLTTILALDPDARVLAQTQLVLNAVFIDVDPAVLDEIAADPRVARVVPVANYELDLSETVPYIGASDVQGDGFDGSGVRVAVLDSGIDYYHAALGGSGNPADYAAADPTVITDGGFPNAKVVGGVDLVGNLWDGTDTSPPLMPDPDPLDDGPGAGHGTHVGHIIGGTGGVAPGVDLYAVKVCSSVSTSCSGMALIQGMEFAVDPNGDFDPSDALDIVNMSLGSNYGQPFDDDLSLAVDNATAAGVLTVASAGNAADKPYIVGTPSAAPTALSVAQTQVPSAALQFLEVDGVDYQAVFQPWSVPLTSIIGPTQVQYGDGAGSNLNGCAPFAAGSLAGLIVLVDRGDCNFTLKIKNIGDAGGEAGIIGLVAPGAPFAGGDGGDAPITIPGYMISQADSNAIKAAITGGGGIGTLDPDNVLPLVGQMVGSSSRGPSNYYQAIKPEIGAPGGSVSAIAGTGTGEGPFGGTSGAAPMVSGSAALLLDAESSLSPLEAKARLMNTGETDIDTDPFTGLAPITRLGGGEVRVDQAVGTPFAAWDDATMSGALSFGFFDVSKDTVNLSRIVRVRNYSGSDQTFSITPTFRYANDVANGAVSVSAPAKVKVKAGQDGTFTVKLSIDGTLLRNNFMNSGNQGANPAVLTLNEYDGYIVLDNGSDQVHVAWQALPRKAAELKGRTTLHFDGGVDVIDLTNKGVGTAQNDAYTLIATSPDDPEGAQGGQSPTPDIRAVGINTFPVPAGFCSSAASFIWAFAVNTWERQSHLVPVSHQVWLDTNQDGTADFVVLNRDLSGLGTIADGRQVTWAVNLTTNTASAFFFAEHSTNTGNTVLYICGEQVGLTGTDMLSTNVDIEVVAQDFYFGGPGDSVGGLTVTPLGEGFFGIPTDIPGKSAGTLTVIDFGPVPGNTPELGVMLVTNGDRGSGLRGGAVQGTEVMLFTP
ncbi:MAG: S8 family serine peptidase [Actinomycetota bacterium]|nr:S8 family serine peptidase [Actinomycetota bacterium]